MLEYGAGGSIFWLASRVASVVALENDATWASDLAQEVPANASVKLVEDMESYDVGRLVQAGCPQIVVVDCTGDRMPCAPRALCCLGDDGCLIWNDTDGPDWPSIEGMMKDAGFRSISFAGMTPQEVAGSRTTVFYRDGNCLGI